MIETGHFAELDNIIRITSRQFKTAESDPDFASNTKTKNKKGEGEEPVESAIEDTKEREEAENDEEATRLQTFVFSATLSKDLQQNLQRRKRPVFKKKAKAAQKSSTLDELLEKLDFRDPEPEIIDLSPKGGLVSTLKESQVECLSADKVSPPQRRFSKCLLLAKIISVDRMSTSTTSSSATQAVPSSSSPPSTASAASSPSAPSSTSTPSLSTPNSNNANASRTSIASNPRPAPSYSPQTSPRGGSTCPLWIMSFIIRSPAARMCIFIGMEGRLGLQGMGLVC